MQKAYNERFVICPKCHAVFDKMKPTIGWHPLFENEKEVFIECIKQKSYEYKNSCPACLNKEK